MILGLLLLECQFDDLKSVGALPNILGGLGFDHARTALLYALGHEDTLRQECWIPESDARGSQGFDGPEGEPAGPRAGSTPPGIHRQDDRDADIERHRLRSQLDHAE
jgi:hypothetical protein